jgi:hypothetical protein
MVIQEVVLEVTAQLLELPLMVAAVVAGTTEILEVQVALEEVEDL